MPLLHRHVLLNLERIHSLEHREPLSNRMNSHVLERFVIEMNEDFSRYSMLCASICQSC